MRHAALQCGYCTPGLLLTLKSLRDAGELSSEEEIRHGLDGNLCRCTGYRSILEAARELAGIDRMSVEQRRRLVGGRRLAAAQGRPREAARPGPVRRRHGDGGDAARQGPAQPATPTRGSARSTSRPALEIEGVAAILTGADLDDIEPYYGHAIKDRPIVAIDRVRFAGEPVAAVAAVDEATARGGGAGDRGRLRGAAGARHARAGARARTPRALHERRPKIGLFHGLGDLGEQQGNVCYRHVLEAGDIEAARERAAITVEGTYTFPAVYQYAMETHATIAHYHGDGVTLWANCQHPFLVQAEIADLFGLPIGSVRIVVGYLGGGFGSKSYTKMEPLTVALARKAGRPVRIVNRVEESMVTSRRHGMRCWMRTTADRGRRRCWRARCASGWTPAPTPTTARA